MTPSTLNAPAASSHRHLITRHKHRYWHGHCEHNPGLKRRRGWPWLKPCNRYHWHFWWRHSHG